MSASSEMSEIEGERSIDGFLPEGEEQVTNPDDDAEEGQLTAAIRALNVYFAVKSTNFDEVLEQVAGFMASKKDRGVTLFTPGSNAYEVCRAWILVAHLWMDLPLSSDADDDKTLSRLLTDDRKVAWLSTFFTPSNLSTIALNLFQDPPEVVQGMNVTETEMEQLAGLWSGLLRQVAAFEQIPMGQLFLLALGSVHINVSRALGYEDVRRALFSGVFFPSSEVNAMGALKEDAKSVTLIIAAMGASLTGPSDGEKRQEFLTMLDTTGLSANLALLLTAVEGISQEDLARFFKAGFLNYFSYFGFLSLLAHRPYPAETLLVSLGLPEQPAQRLPFIQNAVKSYALQIWGQLPSPAPTIQEQLKTTIGFLARSNPLKRRRLEQGGERITDNNDIQELIDQIRAIQEQKLQTVSAEGNNELALLRNTVDSFRRVLEQVKLERNAQERNANENKAREQNEILGTLRNILLAYQDISDEIVLGAGDYVYQVNEAVRRQPYLTFDSLRSAPYFGLLTTAMQARLQKRLGAFAALLPQGAQKGEWLQRYKDVVMPFEFEEYRNILVPYWNNETLSTMGEWRSPVPNDGTISPSFMILDVYRQW